MIDFVLPFPPSLNGLYLNVPKIGRVKSARYKAWEIEATQMMGQQHPSITHFNPKFSVPVEVTYLFTRPDKKIRDLANFFKSVDDFMVRWGIIKDDSLIVKLSAEWSKEGSGVYIVVKEKKE